MLPRAGHARADAGARRVRRPAIGELMADWRGTTPQQPARPRPLPTARVAEATETPELSAASPHLSDTGNAQRFVCMYHGRVLHCFSMGTWLVFDGRVWRPDTTGEVMRLAKATVAAIYDGASHATDDEWRKKLAAWALQSENEKRLNAMISLARAELPVSPEDLDTHSRLLNVLNGTIELDSCTLREHRARDLITKLAPVEFDPAARSETWTRVIEHAMPQKPVRRFAQKLSGYTLSGETGEDVFVSIHGPTRTGKGTFQDALSATLGDYAVTAELDLLAERDRPGGPRPELVRLRGARMVSVYESSRRLKLSASLVKSLAGSDPITARDMFSKPITFRPQAKLWVATNYRPKAPNDDDALWERIRELPFRTMIPEAERDPGIRAQLREPALHGPAILAWALEGCRLWLAEGLQQPDAVRAATREYREEMDPLRGFLTECCVLKSNVWTRTEALRAEYERWARENGERALDGSRFREGLKRHGCAEALRIFREHTGRTRYDPPAGGYREAAAVVGRQSGKTRTAAMIVAFEAMTAPPEPDGTEVYALLIAQDQRSALRTLFRYTSVPFDRVPVLERSVSTRRAETITLESGCVLAAYPCRPQAVRGLRARIVVADELAFYRSTENLPIDLEMLRAVRPCLATTGGKLIILSSPYAQSGALFDLHRRHFGRDDSETLVWQASAPAMNPTLPVDYLSRMEQDDPDAYRSEVLGEFRPGVSTFLDPDAIAACVESGVRERAPEPGRRYVSFTDAASGSGKDAFAEAIAHVEGERVVLDVIRAWRPPFNPSGVIAEAADLLKLKGYGLSNTTGDRYAPGFVAEGFRAHGITYTPSLLDRSQLYLELLPLVNAGRVVLLDEHELLRELRGLERRRGSSGRDRVDHGPGQHDDRANAAAGALALAAQRARVPHVTTARALSAVRAMADLRGPSPLLPSTGDEVTCRAFFGPPKA